MGRKIQPLKFLSNEFLTNTSAVGFLGLEKQLIGPAKNLKALSEKGFRTV